MSDFNTSLLREKFVIRDITAEEDSAGIIALSNRMAAPLINKSGKVLASVIVRAQNMHTAVRIAARLNHDVQDYGELVDLEDRFNWNALWRAVTEGYEDKYNPDCWIAIYYKGKSIFSKGEYHPFLDIIEKFDALQKDDYTGAVKLAEGAFRDAGKLVKIDHDTNVALVVSIHPKEARCGIILRGMNRTKTFNFTARERAGKEVTVPQCLSVAAAYLEGIQLAFAVGMGKRKMHHGLIEGSDERIRIQDGEKRLARLNHAILQFDQMQSVTYRPERPDIFKHLEEAEKFSDKLLKPQIKEKLKSGELDRKDWVN